MVVINVITLDQVSPWVDEVMFMDTPVNFVSGNGWTTHAWYAGGDQTPFSTYPPLYQMLEVVWMSIWGISLVSCRSLNLVLILLLGFACLKLSELFNDRKPSLLVVAIFSLLLWCNGEMAWMYRNGRPDILGAFLCVLSIIYAWNHLKNSKPLWPFVITCGFIVTSGMQATVFMGIVFICLFIFRWDMRKKIWPVFLSFVGGTFSGLLAMIIFMAINGHLFAFLVSVASYSGSLKHIAAELLPTFGPMLGLNPDEWLAKLADDTAPQPLWERILSVYNHIGYLSMILFNIIVIIILRKGLRFKSPYIIVFLIAQCVPILMIIAGRFMSYYHWMTLIPCIMCTTILLPKTNKVTNILLIITTIVVVADGASSFKKNTIYEKQQEWVKNLPITKMDHVAASFPLFYQIWEKTDNTYFPEIYPADSIKNIDYIICDGSSTKGTDKVTLFLEQLSMSEIYDIQIVDSCALPQLNCYKISPKQ